MKIRSSIPEWLDDTQESTEALETPCFPYPTLEKDSDDISFWGNSKKRCVSHYFSYCGWSSSGQRDSAVKPTKQWIMKLSVSRY